jgi:hypothetical protein
MAGRAASGGHLTHDNAVAVVDAVDQRRQFLAPVIVGRKEIRLMMIGGHQVEQHDADARGLVAPVIVTTGATAAARRRQVRRRGQHADTKDVTNKSITTLTQAPAAAATVASRGIFGLSDLLEILRPRLRAAHRCAPPPHPR